MKRKLWNIPAALLVFGAALIFAGCPIVADTRDASAGGPGHLFGPVNQVTVVITDIPDIPAFTGTRSVEWDGVGTRTAAITNGTLTVTFANVSVAQARNITLGGGEGFTGTQLVLLNPGQNSLPYSSFPRNITVRITGLDGHNTHPGVITFGELSSPSTVIDDETLVFTFLNVANPQTPRSITITGGNISTLLGYTTLVPHAPDSTTPTAITVEWGTDFYTGP